MSDQPSTAAVIAALFITWWAHVLLIGLFTSAAALFHQPLIGLTAGLAIVVGRTGVS